MKPGVPKIQVTLHFDSGHHIVQEYYNHPHFEHTMPEFAEECIRILLKEKPMFAVQGENKFIPISRLKEIKWTEIPTSQPGSLESQ